MIDARALLDDDDDEPEPARTVPPPRRRRRVTVEPAATTAPAPVADAAATSAKLPDGRDARTGRFLPGWRGGPGSPPRPRIYDVALEQCARTGRDLRVELGEVIAALVAQAKAGDVQAARVVIEKLCATEDIAVALTAELSDNDRRVRLAAIVTTALSRIGVQHDD